MMKTNANPATIGTASCHSLLYCVELEGGYRGRIGTSMRGVADNHTIYTQTVQLMYPGPPSGYVCVCVCVLMTAITAVSFSSVTEVD